MTQPYEDLFKNGNIPDRNDPLLRQDPPDAEKDFLDDVVYVRKTNWILLAVYVAGMIVVNVAMYAIFFASYGNPAAITANIVEIGVGYDAFDSTLDPLYPYAVSITGRFENRNDSILGSVSAEYYFYDASNHRIGTSSYTADDVGPGAALVVVDTVYFDVAIERVEVVSGFDMSSGFYLAVNAVHTLTLSIFFVTIDRRHLADRWIRFKHGWKRSLGQIAIGACLVYAALIASSVIMELLGIVGSSENEATIAAMFQRGPFRLFALFLTLCVFTPIVEETIFRKVLFGFFPTRFGPIPPIVVSGLIFGLMHVAAYGDFLQSIPYVAMGVVFGYIYWSSNRNMYVTIAVHFINNFISFALYVGALYGLAIG